MTPIAAPGDAERVGRVTALSSMATQGLLAALAAGWDGQAAMQAMGGVEVARRVRSGEPVDVVVLADAVMRGLESDGNLVPGSLAGIVRSGLAIAVREETALPDLSDAAAARHAFSAAGQIGYSTGPSGDHLLRVLDGWGLRAALDGRLVQAPPGVPVGQLLAEGAVDLAVQQRSELLGVPGIVLAGPLPPGLALDTVFTAGIVRLAARPEAARGFIAFLVAAATSEATRRHGMDPA